MASSNDLDPKTVEILRLLSEGHSSEQILEGHPEISHEDIALAAKRALALVTTTPQRTYSLQAIRQRYARAYEKWSREEEQRLLELYRSGRSTREIAAELQRQPGGIRSRLDRLLGGEAPASHEAEAGPQTVSEPEQEEPGTEPESHEAPPAMSGVQCSQCGNPIPQARLDAVQGTTLCVRCQEASEHLESDEGDDLLCPRCRSKLLWKQPRDAEQTTYFLACSAYPACHYIDPTTGLGFRQRRR